MGSAKVGYKCVAGIVTVPLAYRFTILPILLNLLNINLVCACLGCIMNIVLLLLFLFILYAASMDRSGCMVVCCAYSSNEGGSTAHYIYGQGIAKCAGATRCRCG